MFSSSSSSAFPAISIGFTIWGEIFAYVTVFVVLFFVFVLFCFCLFFVCFCLLFFWGGCFCFFVVVVVVCFLILP